MSWDDAQQFLKELNQRDSRRAGSIAYRRRRNGSTPVENGPMTDKSESAFDFYFEKPLAVAADAG